MKNRSLLLIFVLFLSSCSSDEDGNATMPVDAGSPDVKKELIRVLDREGIGYREIDGTTIEVMSEDIQQVMLYANRVSNSIVPFDRSAALPQPNRNRFLELLNKNELDYKMVKYAGQDWIVWREADHDEVLRLLDKVSESNCCPD